MQATNLIFWVILCQLPFVSGAAVAAGNYAWYQSLNLPAFTPPNWLFAPVWTVLCVLMGASAFTLTKNGLTAPMRPALLAFAAQLVLNALWMPVFFGLHRTGLALLLSAVMLGMTVWTVRLFGRVNKNAAWLLAPYLIWLLFAAVLNAAVWWMN